MACCNDPTGKTAETADPASHVNFTRGMVLGVEDYRQEHAYLAGQIRWLARETLGYGATTGLSVAMEGGLGDPVVRVSAGTAVLPSGRLVCVASDQCAKLNAWLAVAANAAAVEKALTKITFPPASPPAAARLTLHVILSHHECLTVPVPIPGEPCRPEDELMAPSRVTDDYRLELSLSPPLMREHEAAASFATFLGSVNVISGMSPPSGGTADWQAALSAWSASILGEPATSSPPGPSSPPAPASPPAAPPTVAAADWPAFKTLALRFWTAQVRPKVIARRCNCGCQAEDDKLLLASLDVPLVHAGTPPADQWQVDNAGGGILVDETVRAILPSLQLVTLIQAAARAATA